MTDKKFEFAGETKEVVGVTLHRIRALRNFGVVKAGDLGGWLEYEANLSHVGNAWVSGNARVSGNACVYGDAWVSGDAKVYGDARVFNYAIVIGKARVCDHALVFGNAQVYDNAKIRGNSVVDSGTAAFWAVRVGRDNGTLTVTKAQSGNLLATRGCFTGTIDEFLAKSKVEHDAKTHLEYQLLMQVARMRILGELPA